MWKPHWQTTPHSQVILSPWDLEFKRRGPCGVSSGFSATPPFPALPLKLGRAATLLAPELLINPEALFNPEVLLGMWSMVPFASGFAGGTSWGAEASLAFEATEWLGWPGWPDALLVLPMVGESGPGFVGTGGTWAGSSGGPTGAPMGGLGMTGGRGSRGGLATATSAGVHSKLLSQISSGPLRLNPCRQSTSPSASDDIPFTETGTSAVTPCLAHKEWGLSSNKCHQTHVHKRKASHRASWRSLKDGLLTTPTKYLAQARIQRDTTLPWHQPQHATPRKKNIRRKKKWTSVLRQGYCTKSLPNKSHLWFVFADQWSLWHLPGLAPHLVIYALLQFAFRTRWNSQQSHTPKLPCQATTRAKMHSFARSQCQLQRLSQLELPDQCNKAHCLPCGKKTHGSILFQHGCCNTPG